MREGQRAAMAREEHVVVIEADKIPTNTPVKFGDWVLERTLVRRGASIGSGAVILPGVTIGHPGPAHGSFIDAGAHAGQNTPPPVRT